jgi:hypothetical protein
MINNQCLRKTACLCLIFFAGLGVPLACAQTASLASLQSMYTNKVAGLESETQKKKILAVQEYGADLQTTLKAVQKAGDFDGYVLVEKEIARFKSDKTVPSASPSPQLLTSVANYQKKIETVNTELAGKKIEICKQYLATLIALRKDLMVQNKMKEAGEVNDLAKQVDADIKEMESWTSQTGEVAIAPAKPETKLDELFGDDPEPAKPKIITAETVKVTATSTSAVKKKSKKAPPEAIEFNDHFYQYCAEKTKWDTAKAKCQTRGGHLVSITSKEENDFVARLVKGKAAVWIGLYKPVDAWKWVNLEKADYLNWGSGEPNITKRSPYMGVGICAFIRGEERYISSSYVNGIYRPSHTEASGEWEDAYSDAGVDGYVCEWDE